MKCFWWLLVILLRGHECARILGIFPTPSYSHQIVFHALMKDLAARGHELTIMTTDLMKIDNPNVTQIDLHDSYVIFRKYINFVHLKQEKKDESFMAKAYIPITFKIMGDQLSKHEVHKIINKSDGQSFDLVILEYLHNWPMLAFAEIYNCSIIGITSLDTNFQAHEEIGNGAIPTILSDILTPFAHGELSFSDRWRSLKYYFKCKFMFDPKITELSQEMISKFFPNVTTPISKLKDRVELLMTNTNPALGFIRPLLPNTIQLGFMHIEPAKPLPNGELKSFLDNSKNGVVYMNLGSNANSKDFNPKTLHIFIKVFGSLSYDVLWKFEADELPNKPKNVMINKWLPQSDLLAHPSIKVFITQGGQQSMEEAIDRAIPMIVIPFIGDQDSNAKRMVSKGIGYHLEFNTLTEEELMRAISEMLKPKYKENIKRLRTLVYDQPMTSRERAVWWTEYVIRNKGAKHLKYPGKLVPFYQKYSLDFIAIFAVSVIVVTKVIGFIFKKK